MRLVFSGEHKKRADNWRPALIIRSGMRPISSAKKRVNIFFASNANQPSIMDQFGLRGGEEERESFEKRRRDSRRPLLAAFGEMSCKVVLFCFLCAAHRSHIILVPLWRDLTGTAPSRGASAWHLADYACCRKGRRENTAQRRSTRRSKMPSSRRIQAGRFDVPLALPFLKHGAGSR